MNPTADGGFALREATIADVHAAFEAGELTARELVDRYLRRIEAHDDALNAILRVNPNARERAAELDEAFADGPVGPLHGVPVVLKDNHDTADMPTTAGSTTLAESVPERDAFVVRQLRAAGAVVIAKANLQEFSFGVDTISSLGGETKNAYDRGRRPSGSSGGTAAAIAANLGLVGTGSDTCSSVRSPPAFNCLVGVRPTRGLVSRSGIVPLSESQDTAGPIARTVADAARLLEAMAGHDPDDPVTAAGVGHVPADGYAAHLDPDGLEGARIGVPRELYGLQEPTSAPASAARAVTAVLEDALEAMEAAGATLVDPVEIPDRDRLASARTLGYEFGRDLAAYLAELPDPPYRTLEAILDSGQVAPAVHDRLVDGDVTGLDIEDPAVERAYLRRLRRRRELATELRSSLVAAELDALVYPPSTVPPVEIPENQPFVELPCELAAHTGFPAVVVPAGFTEDGLPVGLELLGREFAEPRLFELAYAFERETGHRRPPDGFESPA